MKKAFKEMSFIERIAYIQTLTDTEKLELMTHYGAWSEKSPERMVAHYVQLCEELPELYMAMTDGGMSYNSYSPKNDVIVQFERYNLRRSFIAMMLDDFKQNNDIDGFIKWINEETIEFL